MIARVNLADAIGTARKKGGNVVDIGGWAACPAPVEWALHAAARGGIVNRNKARTRANKSACPWCDARDGFKNPSFRINELPEEMVQSLATVLLQPKKIAKALAGEEGEKFRCKSCDAKVKYCPNCDCVNREVGEFQKCRGCKRQI